MNKENLEKILIDVISAHLEKLDDYVANRTETKKKIEVHFANDPLYSLFGLDSPEYITAAFGGGLITSIHRKIGDAFEEAVQVIVKETLGLTEEEIKYSAKITSGDSEESRSLDCFIQIEKLEKSHKESVKKLSARLLQRISSKPKIDIQGMAFEIRHCYQSADSKRAQADEAMARHCLVSGYVPIMLVFCNQSNRSIIKRYQAVWVLTEGVESYELIKELTGFDMYDFLKRNKKHFSSYIKNALKKLQHN